MHKKSTRKIRVAPRVAFDLIMRQSGSREKALVELVCNAIDGSATRVEIQLPDDGCSFSVIDDGEGFKNPGEVEKYYENLGFEHKGDQYEERRQFGYFGLGRAQAWAYASTVYITQNMRIFTDVKNKGLDYDLIEEPHTLHDGCRVDGTFYETVSPSELNLVKRELRRWLRFVNVPVELNGERINDSVENVKWTIEDEDAYYLFDSSNTLQIYNMGAYVRDLNTWDFGTGGLIVTKEKLDLDMSRTQLLSAVCPRWRRIKSKVKALHRDAALTSNRLSDAKRCSLIQGLLAGEIDFSQVIDKKLFVNVKGRSMSALDIYQKGYVSFCIAGFQNAHIADRLHGTEGLLVLSNKTCEQWGLHRHHRKDDDTNAATHFVNVLTQVVKASQSEFNPQAMRVCALVPQDFDNLCEDYRGDHRFVHDKDLPPEALVMLNAVRRNVMMIRTSVRGNSRRLIAGHSPSMNAWTDGENYVALTVDVLLNALNSESNLRLLYRLLVHEFCHDDSSESDHSHDHAFFENFHDVILDSTWSETNFVRYVCREVHRSTQRKTPAMRSAPKWMRDYLNDKQAALAEGQDTEEVETIALTN